MSTTPHAHNTTPHVSDTSVCQSWEHGGIGCGGGHSAALQVAMASRSGKRGLQWQRGTKQRPPPLVLGGWEGRCWGGSV
jgi:hypothetical protein